MPASEEDFTKPNILKEQLRCLDINLSRTSKSVGEHKSRECGQNNMMIKYLNEKFITHETSSTLKMITSQQSCKENRNADNRTNDAKENAFTKAKFEKDKVDRILNEISKMGPQVFKDIMNYLKKRLDSKERPHFDHSSDNKVIDSLSSSYSDEMRSLSYSENNSTDDEDDEMTCVKEAFAICRKDPFSFNFVDSEDKELDVDSVSIDCKKSNKWQKIQVKHMNLLDYIQYKNNPDDSGLEMLKNEDGVPMKYLIDMMETEKTNSPGKEGKSMETDDVQEKYDFEKVDKNLQMGYAEIQDLNTMLYSESLSKVSCGSFRLPSLPSCFLPTRDCLPSLLDSLESLLSSVGDNRLSLEWHVPRNFCYHGNIFASRQTNISSIIASDNISFSRTCKLQHIPEKMLIHVENKACNLKLLDSIDPNVCQVSVSKQYESKDVIELMDSWFNNPHKKNGYCDSQKGESIQELSLLDFVHVTDDDSSFGGFKDKKPLSDYTSMQKENIVDDCEELNFSQRTLDFECIQETAAEDVCEYLTDVDDSFGEKQIVETEVVDSCGELENSESGCFFDSLLIETENSLREMNDPMNKTGCSEETKFSFGGISRNGGIRDQKNRNEYRDMQEGNKEKITGDGKCPDICSCSIDFLEEEIKDKCAQLKSPEYVQRKKIKQCAQRCGSDDFAILLQGQSWQVKDERRIIGLGDNRDKENALTKLDWKQDREEDPQEHCHRVSWKGGFLQDLFESPSNRNKEDRRHRYLTKRELKKDIKFGKKAWSAICRATIFRSKAKRHDRKKKNKKQRNHVKLKYEKPASSTEHNRRELQYFQKNGFSMKGQSRQNIKDMPGNLSHLIGDPPVQLHLVKAKVWSRSGGEGGHRNSDRGSSSGAQGDGNHSSCRGHGSSRQYGNGNGSGTGDDGNNNDNNDDSKISNNQKGNSKNKKNKRKKTGNESSPDGSPPEAEHLFPSPSLPTPQLDPQHMAERRSVEKFRQPHNTYPSNMLPSGSVLTSDQNERVESPGESVDIFSIGLNILPGDEEVPNIQHAAVSICQLCDTIGDATKGLPSRSDTFNMINHCLAHLIHNLALAANEDKEAAALDNCNVCPVLSQLLIHMADPGHDGIVRSCEQCSQIFNLTMQHCITCIESNRSRSRLTQSDLCYKICKYSQWNVDNLKLNANRLMSKVQKYCDKVLGSIADMMSLRYLDGEDVEVMAEIGASSVSDMPSTGLSSTTLSLGGNIVTLETGEQEQQTYPEEAHPPLGPVNVPFVNPSLAGPAGGTANEACHVRLSRKPSQQRKTPAIPPSIVEENQTLECGVSATASANGTDEGRRDDIGDIIYQRWGSSVDDPNETQRTYGERNQYGSLPLGNVHDGAQFYSVSTQPLGVPGIGEVVYALKSQLRIIAQFWDKKREECERTKTCPYQHREEGAILADQKENFGILHMRYQKHHQWERVSHLGNGMSGKCHLAIDLKTNFKFCCKKIHLLRYTEEEVSLWSEMHNAYIVRLYGAIRHGVKIYIFSEFIDGGSLAACIEEQKRLGRRLSHWSAINYFQQLLKVLAFLQKKNILHEDIKADNILLRRNSTYLAVTDFGTSRRLQGPNELKNKSPVGSPTHWSPEKASMEGHGFPSDLWASVCVLVHMLSGEPPWVKRFMNKAAILNFIIYQRPPPMEDVPNNVQLVVRDLIERGFVKDPQTRPSSSELLRHPAFSILDEGTPETYFSTLMSMAHSGLHAIRVPVGASEIQDLKEPPSNTLAEASVLFEAKVSSGPYQESDSRPDHRNHHTGGRLLEASDSKEQINTFNNNERDEDCNETNESTYEGTETNAADDGGKAAGGQDENTKIAENPVPVEADQVVLACTMDSKVFELVGPLDIYKLLPQFNELFVSGDSLTSQSIKSFFADVYDQGDLNETKQPTLQVYKPEERTDELPNLSIFDTSWEAASEQKDATACSAPDIVDVIPNLPQIGESAGLPFRRSLLTRPTLPHSPMHFTLSSESDDCTSADLFESEPAARNPDTAQNASCGIDTNAKHDFSSSSKQNVDSFGDVSPTASTGSTLSSSGTSNLQQRKPVNLTLNVACALMPSVISDSQSDTQTYSATSTNENEQKHRPRTWSQHSTSAQISQHSSSTPSSSHTSGPIRKISGTSVSSTASSGHSQFIYNPSSVREEQELMLQELIEINAYSHSSTDSERPSYAEYLQQYPTNNETSEYEENTDIQTVRKTMLEEIDETKLGGHELKFYGDRDKHLFTMRIEELPTNWRRLITLVRQKISHYGYHHFIILHMNNVPVKLHHPLTTCEFRVVRKQDEKGLCLCQQCYTMY